MASPLDAAIHHIQSHGAVFNMGGPEALSRVQLAKKLAEVRGYRVTIDGEPGCSGQDDHPTKDSGKGGQPTGDGASGVGDGASGGVGGRSGGGAASEAANGNASERKAQDQEGAPGGAKGGDDGDDGESKAAIHIVPSRRAEMSMGYESPLDIT